MFNIHLSIERWKWNPDFELYVSNKGHFRNRDKKDVPIQVGNGGYCWVYCGGTTHKHLLAHRVVMLTWRPTPNAEHLTIDHLNHNKRDNSLENLEWVTRAENIRRAKADAIVVKVEGNADLVEKVDVSITPKDRSPQSKYDFLIKLNKAVVLSVEEFAALFFDNYGKNFTCPFTHKNCQTLSEFCAAIEYRIKIKSDKLFGFMYETIEKKEGDI